MMMMMMMMMMITVQLKHVFTGKFIHISTTQTSRRDKNNMLVNIIHIILENYGIKCHVCVREEPIASVKVIPAVNLSKLK